jgi:uncharacterized protein (DUF2235 family)
MATLKPKELRAEDSMADLRTLAKPSQSRLALFLDGTWDKEEGNTNVWRSKCLCAPVGQDGLEQKVFYSAGVGTSVGSRLTGGAFGKGIDDVILEAYEWLVETYENGDEVFIFGFSRGAFTARSLAGFISRCGIVRAGAPLGINQLYDRYKRGNLEHSIHELREPQADSSKFTLEERWMVRDCYPAFVKFTGVWDTVGAFAKTDFAKNVTGGEHTYLDANLRQTESFVYHALAIDENRADFDATLLSVYHQNNSLKPYESPRPLSAVEQRWFVGAHGDVGGGSYNDLLAQIPLKWLLLKASSHGLTFRQTFEVEPDALTTPVEDSYSNFLNGAYKLLELGKRHYRPIDRPPLADGDWTIHTVNETIDGSVFDRWRADAKYRPQNLQEWANGHFVKIENLHGSKQAADPKQDAPE